MSQELLLPAPRDENWITLDKTQGMQVNTLWTDPTSGASIAILRVPKGAGIPVRHIHASNQFMYCIEGEYRYLEPEPGLVLRKGSFYSNPKGHPHGPTVALTDCVLLEIYDGPHYFELPVYHNEKTVGKIVKE
jgi:quercetin dioxygenase-like cupin family protein